MLDLGWQEFFLIATIAVVVVGPQDLPKVIRTVVGWIRKVRSMARDFQGSIEEVAREAELGDIRKEAEKLRSGNLSETILDAVDPDRDLSNALKDTRADIEGADVKEGGKWEENSMLAPSTVANPSEEAARPDDDGIKGWDASSVDTPSNSIMPPPPAEEVGETPTSKPRAKRGTKAGGTSTVTKPADKPAQKPRSKAATRTPKTAEPKAQTTSKPATARKPRKPRAAARITSASPVDTPATEA
jgi:sec-independent protein translocase protein TatB